ncbi:unnamed protein product [Orchesella dallaii]|uniref:Ig-like domain-containing protein n=1 Tax=Orchesella dallaii TaxID=48710 RepID=A0ABP1RYR6_9HEXA
MTVTIHSALARVCPSLLLFCLLLVPGSTHDRAKGLEPEFDVQLPNLTIKQGSDASFTCIVKHLGEYKVAWLRSEDKAIIAWYNHMVTHNHRYSVTHNGHNTWTLHLKNVQQNDSGTYMCQVNTDPQRSQYGTLDVVVPADIIDTETSNDVVVAENQPATLKCKAKGYPPPKVRWKRQDGAPLPISKEFLRNPAEKIEMWEGERLPLRPLLREDTGPYLCIANNSVPPLVSKRVMVYVHFKPSVTATNQLVAAPLGVNITLVCEVQAVPKPVLSWFNKGEQIILNSVGRIWQETEVVKDYMFRMRLSISYLQKDDFREYNCTAGNSLGADYKVIKLQQLPSPPPTAKPTHPTTTHVDIWRPMKHANNNGGNNPGSNSIPNIKHAKNHRRKFQRNRQGHGGARGEGEYYEGGGLNGEDGGDSSAEKDLTSTASYGWGDGKPNRDHSQRSAKESGSNSINGYNDRNSNSNNRGGGGGIINDHPNLSQAASRSSRKFSLVIWSLTLTFPISYLFSVGEHQKLNRLAIIFLNVGFLLMF